jgi:hypothetical protein
MRLSYAADEVLRSLRNGPRRKECAVIAGNPIAKFLLYAWCDERVDWDEMRGWGEQLGVDIGEIVDLQAACAMTRRSGWTMLAPIASQQPFDAAADALAFAYGHGWIGFDDIVRWGEDRELEEERMLLLLERCALTGHGAE